MMQLLSAARVRTPARARRFVTARTPEELRIAWNWELHQEGIGFQRLWQRQRVTVGPSNFDDLQELVNFRAAPLDAHVRHKLATRLVQAYYDEEEQVPRNGSAVAVGGPKHLAATPYLLTAAHNVAPVANASFPKEWRAESMQGLKGNARRTSVRLKRGLTSVMGPVEATVRAYSEKHDLALLELPATKQVPTFMHLGPFVENPEYAAFWGFRVEVTAKNARGELMTREELDEAFGLIGEMSGVAFAREYLAWLKERKPLETNTPLPLAHCSEDAAVAWKGIEEEMDVVVTKVPALKGHSGSGFSVEPHKVCGVVVSEEPALNHVSALTPEAVRALDLHKLLGVDPEAFEAA